MMWNRSQATAHNVYLLLYPQGRLRTALTAHPDLRARVFEALKRIKPSQVISEGRVYGGGLHKVELGELAQIPARVVLESIETTFASNSKKDCLRERRVASHCCSASKEEPTQSDNH